eukprot:1888051-Amphidinium_carterae.3
MSEQPALTAAQRGARTRKERAVAKKKAEGIVEAGEHVQESTAVRAAEWVRGELLEDIPLLYTVKEMLEQGTLAQMLMPKHLVKQDGEEQWRQKLKQGQKKFKQLADKNVAFLFRMIEPGFLDRFDGDGPHTLLDYLCFALQVEGDTDLPLKYSSACYWMDGLAAACMLRYEALGRRLQDGVPSLKYWDFDGEKGILTVQVDGQSCSADVSMLGFDAGSRLENEQVLNGCKLLSDTLAGGFLCCTLLAARGKDVHSKISAAFAISEKEPFDMSGFEPKHDQVRSMIASQDISADSVAGQSSASTVTPCVKRARSFEMQSTSKISCSASFAAALLQRGGTQSSQASLAK